MRIAICIQEKFRFITLFPFLKLLIENNINVLIISEDIPFLPNFYNLNNLEDLNNLKQTPIFISKSQKKNKLSFPRFNFKKNSFNFSFKRFTLHIIYPLLKFIKISNFIFNLLEIKVVRIIELLQNNKYLMETDVVFCLSDRNLWLDVSLAFLCKTRNVPFVIPYFARLVGPNMLASKSYFYDFSKKQYKYYPSYISDFVKIFFAKNPDKALTIGKLFDSYVCCNNEKMRERFLNYGLKKEKLPVLGDLNLLRQKRVYTQEDKYVVFSIPQFYEHKMMSRRKHFVVLNNIMKKLSKSKYKVLVSLHPRSNIKDYAKITSLYGMEIINKYNLFEILPNAQYLVCTFSSTYISALDFNTPVVMFDHFFKFSIKDEVEKDSNLTIILNQEKYNQFSFEEYENNIHEKNSFNNNLEGFKDVSENYINFIKSFKNLAATNKD